MKSEWLSDELIQKAQVLWVVDKAVGVEEIVVGLRNRLPLLVPEDNAELKDLCVYGKCGLYSRDPFETVECLKCLTQNEPLRQIMGQNGLMLFAASRVERT